VARAVTTTEPAAGAERTCGGRNDVRLLLIRHGQTLSNVNRLLDTGEPGPALTELGARQAAGLPGLLVDERIEAIYASTLIRAQLTADPLAQARRLPVSIRPGIREISAGDLEMLGDAKSVEVYVSTVFAWVAGDLATRMPGGEDGHEAMGRFGAVVEEVAASGARTAALVSHGAVIRMWAARSGNVDVGFAAANVLVNAGLVVLEGDPAGGWQVESWGGMSLPAPELA
jgi:probable phosphoglycerate mutase